MSAIDVRESREILNLTQQDLANMFDVCPRTVYSWEKRGTPPKAVVMVLKEKIKKAAACCEAAV